MDSLESKQAAQDKINKLKKSKFKQQTLANYRPAPKLNGIIATFIVFGAIFNSIGLAF